MTTIATKLELPPPLLTSTELARGLNVDRRRLRYLDRRGLIPKAKFLGQRSRVFDRREILDWLEVGMPPRA